MNALGTLAELFARNVALFEDDVAWVAAGRQATYAILDARARRLASSLQEAGCRHGDRVAILSQNSPEYLETLVACWMTGCIAATLNFRLSAAEYPDILNEVAPKVLIVEAAYAAMIDELRDRIRPDTKFVCIGENGDWATPYESFLANGGTPAAVTVRPEDIAHLIYTSGSTGRPKGVMQSHAMQIATAQAMSCNMDLRPGSRLLEVMPFFHAGAQTSWFGLLWRGGTVYVQRGFEARPALEAIAHHRITHLHLVPLMAQALLAEDASDLDLTCVETILYAAAPMPVPVLAAGIARFGPVFVNAWGMTEGTGSSLPKNRHSPTGPDAILLGSIGVANQGCAIRIVDENEADVSQGIVGELWLNGPSVMSGYWNNHSGTVEAMRDGWLRTGDMGYADPRGHIFLVDRKKDMIISGGENIYSQEVERALMSHPSVSAASVIGMPDPKWGESVLAVVILRPGAALDEATLTEHCRQRIASYKKPKTIHFVETIPTLPSGKVDKVRLRATYCRVPDALGG